MITLTDSPDPCFETVLEEGLAEYSAEKVGGRDWRALAVTVHDPDTGELAVGLLGRTSMGLFFLDLFCLPAKLRGGGIGSRVLRTAEEEAVRRGCRAATLVTVNFQAPEFYARHGYLPYRGYAPYASRYGLQRVIAMNGVRVRVSESGRISLPAEFRKAVGLERGGDVVVELEGREIRIRTLDEVVAHAQALTHRLLRGNPDATVDAFLAERRRDIEGE